ncbi:MAG: bifunctional proline dehydrogenase/L-glutamate gamma-semialdehyde dehydrogenase [Micavibrio aeruginosavorus]|uniref:L-glutamate gamma-semialdehyde dehydrogenase n=1 Tax=Micavibrio aeruginosavorus TaxID=349221 RepID=A0A2W5FLY5_9BACT|nr:MAG: bifunctional proline dehydrogenase/L-glutamate gamma-semialdehyde dehydrogenase [Micavibrio aeruginosavorus]
MNFSFASDHLKDETKVVNQLLESLSWDGARAKRVENFSSLLINKIKSRKSGVSEIEHFLEHFPLQSEGGLALMTLAEALLRIPDSDTKDALIEEKLTSADWSQSGGDMFLKAAGVGLSLAQKTLGSFLGSIGKPVIRKSLEEAVRRIGHQFVIGETIAQAIKNAHEAENKKYRLSYDMLGEGARTRIDAERYFKSYENAAHIIGKSSSGDPHSRSGMSVKLSALHPRYVWTQGETCVPEIAAKLKALCLIAKSYDMGLTVDAEEADRLELSLKIIEQVSGDPELKDWSGFGLAIQAYDKRCFRLIDDLYEMTKTHGRKLQIRLVKGAYWDSEIKKSHIAGLPDYPLFTRKANTDLSYLACAQKLLSYRDHIYPMFATHNAQSVAGVLELAGDRRSDFEFQRLYGMGESLHDLVLADTGVRVCIYAPVGSHEELLPYLVRRMLENGANTSFIHQLREAKANDELAHDFIAGLRAREVHSHAKIPVPRYIYADRINSSGADFSAEKIRSGFQAAFPKSAPVSSIIAGENQRAQVPVHIPYPSSIPENSGEVWEISPHQIESVFISARKGFQEWSRTSSKKRAEVLRRIADLLERSREELIYLLRSEGGRTLLDALSEIREATDFCRYYAAQGEPLFNEAGEEMEGPTGESNRLYMAARGIFICISPWNFPAAIFTGQIVAALMAGNSVIAKPAEQTPKIAYRIIRLMHEAGIPKDALNLVLGDGKIGSVLVGHKDVAGVVFTGSTEVAKSINRSLANKEGAIVPLIAETGGQNAMIVESSALIEQVIDDVLISAFGSAGQRCSALRVVYVQDDIYESFCSILKGAMVELKVGDSRDISNDIGPVIDSEALRNLHAHQEYLKTFARLIGAARQPENLNGYYFAPHAYEIDTLSQLRGEVFGPILHVIRFKSKSRDKVIEEINSTGYGLTFGLHSRLSNRFAETASRVDAGNIYINRSMTGAVVGVQPFGGMGLSGTGPKAGGPYYLHRFATERTISINTTATGGNLELISLEDN